MFIYIYIYTHTHTYIHIQREREISAGPRFAGPSAGQRPSESGISWRGERYIYIYIYILCIYVYIYIMHIYIQRERDLFSCLCTEVCSIIFIVIEFLGRRDLLANRLFVSRAEQERHPNRKRCGIGKAPQIHDHADGMDGN